MRVQALLLAGLLCLAACGYRMGLVLPEGQRQVGVRFFSNDSPQPDLERALHGAVTRALRDRTQAELVRPERAKLVVSGRILDYRRRRGIRSAGNLWQESAVIIEVESSLIEVSSGVELARTRSSSSVGFTFGVAGGEAQAARRALNNLGERLVLELFVLAERKHAGS